MSLGNSKRFSGVRINAVDQGVEEINGLNLTLWNPGPGPDAVYNGITLGLIGTKGRRVHGIALSGIGINARERVRGIAAGLLGVGTEEFTGLAFGGVMVDSKRFFRGINISGFWTGNAERFEGLAISPGVATASNVKGAAFGGFFAGAEESLKGLAVSGGGAFAAQGRGVAIGGFAAGGVDFAGIALSLGGIGGKRLDGIMMAGLGMGATERVRGVAIGGLLAVAPEVTGLMAGALNGLYIDRIDLEDFLHFNLANERFTGLSIGVVNYTARLKGVQLGLINYAGNNPRWLRLLPLINVHL